MSHSMPQLSDKEKVERLAAEQCFICGGADHFSRNCPTKGLVRSSSGKPPGASSFNIEPAVTEDDSDDVEVLDSLPVGAIMMELDGLVPDLGDEGPELTSTTPQDEEDRLFWPLSKWKEHYPYWGQPGILARHRIGDSYLMVANSVLTLRQPYPGDEYLPNTIELRPEVRFLVSSRGETYQIYDALIDVQVTIESSLMR
jgi:Zinc knuckle